MLNFPSSARLWITAGLLVGAFLLLHNVSHGEAVVLHQPLQELPYTLDSWTGTEQPLQERIIQAVGVSDYTNRIYFSPQLGAAQLYVGYYASQRTGDTIHSPKNCLPGAGWDPVRSGYIKISVSGGRQIIVNEYVIQQGLDKTVGFLLVSRPRSRNRQRIFRQVLDGGGRDFSQSHRWRLGPSGYAHE